MQELKMGGPKKTKDMKMQDLKMKDLLGMRPAFVIRYSEHSWRAYTGIRFLYEFYYRYTKKTIHLEKYNSSLHATHVRIHDRWQTDWTTQTRGQGSSPVQSRSRDSRPVTSVQSTQTTTLCWLVHCLAELAQKSEPDRPHR